MKKLLLSLALAGSLAVAACGTIPSVGTVLPAGTLTLVEQGDTVAHSGHAAAAVGLKAAADSGALKGIQASSAETLLNQSYADLKLVDTAIQLGDATTAQADLDAANSLILQVNAITGAKK